MQVVWATISEIPFSSGIIGSKDKAHLIFWHVLPNRLSEKLYPVATPLAVHSSSSLSPNFQHTFNILWVFFFDITTKLNKLYFLKGYLLYEIWSHINKLFYSITLKSIALFCTLSGSFTHAWFYNSVHWCFGRYWFMELHRSSKYLHI